MSDPAKLYYLIHSGPVLQAYQDFVKLHQDQSAARMDCAKRHGGSGVYGNAREIIGIHFEEGTSPPAGWRRVPRVSNVWKPGGNTPKSKAIRKEFATFPCITWKHFQQSLGLNELYFMALPNIYFLKVEKIGQQHVLLVPKLKEDKWTPPEGCQPLKTSEYHALLEAEEEAMASQPQ